MNLAIIVGAFDESLTGEMEKSAVKTAKKNGWTVKKIIKVPGSFDIPLALKKMLKQRDIDAAAVLGAIVKGETKHDEVIGFALAKTIHELELQYNKPVGFGIIGPGVTWKQAKARAADYGERAVEAAIALSKL